MKTEKEINLTKELVEIALQNCEEARNSDIRLLTEVWRLQGIKIFIPFDTKDMIKPSTISRCRRTIQNEEKRFLPTDPEIKEKRGKRQEEFREYYGRK